MNKADVPNRRGVYYGRRCQCVADHNLDGNPARCLNPVMGKDRKCANCKVAYWKGSAR